MSNHISDFKEKFRERIKQSTQCKDKDSNSFLRRNVTPTGYVFVCIICNGELANEGQWLNHRRSKIHTDALKKLKLQNESRKRIVVSNFNSKDNSTINSNDKNDILTNYNNKKQESESTNTNTNFNPNELPSDFYDEQFKKKSRKSKKATHVEASLPQNKTDRESNLYDTVDEVYTTKKATNYPIEPKEDEEWNKFMNEIESLPSDTISSDKPKLDKELNSNENSNVELNKNLASNELSDLGANSGKKEDLLDEEYLEDQLMDTEMVMNEINQIKASLTRINNLRDEVKQVKTVLDYDLDSNDQSYYYSSSEDDDINFVELDNWRSKIIN